MAVDTRVIERTITIEASPETVFRLLTDPVEYVRWKGRIAKLEPTKGGTFRVQFADPKQVASGRYVEVVPNRRVVFTWGGRATGSTLRAGTSSSVGSPTWPRDARRASRRRATRRNRELLDMDTSNPMGYAMVHTHAGKGIGAGSGAPGVVKSDFLI